MDFQLFQLLNNLAGKNYILDFLGIFLASYAIWLLVFLIAVLAFLPAKRDMMLTRANTCQALLAGLLGWGLARVIGLFLYRSRPYITHEVNKLIEQLFVDKSFPSDHATGAFALACTIYLFNRKIGIWFLIGASLIALSRIYVGVHYPSDVLLGAILGVASAMIIKKLIPKKYRD